ncbi:MAG: GNAT family N-acetyltransferase, partial [Candidatus Neomarinimicrobiota bacterium]
SLNFFNSLPEIERRYLRSKVTDRNHIEARIQSSLSGQIIRRIVTLEDRIIADGSLEILSDEWKEGTGYMRLVIHSKFRNLGAGFVLAWNLYQTAYDNKLKRIITKLMRPQTDLVETYEELGFKHEGLLPNYVIDQLGKEQDMIIMVCSLEELRNAHAFIGDWIEAGHASIGAGEM